MKSRGLEKLLTHFVLVILALPGCTPTYEEYASVPRNNIAAMYRSGRIESHEFFGVIKASHADCVYIGIYPSENFRSTEGFGTDLPQTLQALLPDTVTTNAEKKASIGSNGVGNIKLVIDNATDTDFDFTIDEKPIGIVRQKANLLVMNLKEGLHRLCTRPAGTAGPVKVKEVLVTSWAIRRVHELGHPVEFYVYNVNGINSYNLSTQEYGSQEWIRFKREREQRKRAMQQEFR